MSIEIPGWPQKRVACVAVALLIVIGACATVGAGASADDPSSWILEALLEPDPGPPPSQLGAAVAISQKRAVVGNRRNHDLGTDTGLVHTYDQVRKAWRAAPVIREPGGCVTCDFGASLALDSDRLIVGAPRDGALSFEAGRAHIFTRRGTKWVLEMTLTRPKPAASDLFGQAVAVRGRIAVVGAPYADGPLPSAEVTTPDCGAAEVYEQRDGVWTHVATLNPPIPASSAWFGAAVAVEGDLIAVGAYGQPDGTAPTGAVHLYRRSATEWVLEQSLACPWPGAAWFGASVAIDDGRVLVGAPRVKAPGSNAATGAAFLFERESTGFALVASLAAPWLSSGDGFGISVALDRDSAFVGATGDDEGGNDSGAVYLFTRSGASFRPAEKLAMPGATEGDRAGATIAAARGRLIVGRGGDPESDPRPGEGVSWVFTSPTVSPSHSTSPVGGSTRPPTGRRSQTRGRSRRATAQESRSG